MLARKEAVSDDVAVKSGFASDFHVNDGIHEIAVGLVVGRRADPRNACFAFAGFASELKPGRLPAGINPNGALAPARGIALVAFGAFLLNERAVRIVGVAPAFVRCAARADIGVGPGPAVLVDGVSVDKADARP